MLRRGRRWHLRPIPTWPGMKRFIKNLQSTVPTDGWLSLRGGTCMQCPCLCRVVLNLLAVFKTFRSGLPVSPQQFAARNVMAMRTRMPPDSHHSSEAYLGCRSRASPIGRRCWKNRRLLKQPVSDADLRSLNMQVKKYPWTLMDALREMFMKACGVLSAATVCVRQPAHAAGAQRP
jgi:hypothetical protein